jgi:hypothetical protein
VPEHQVEAGRAIEGEAAGSQEEVEADSADLGVAGEVKRMFWDSRRRRGEEGKWTAVSMLGSSAKFGSGCWSVRGSLKV